MGNKRKDFDPPGVVRVDPGLDRFREAVRAIRIHKIGGPEALRLDAVDNPHPGDGEVVLRVTAAAVNRFDVDIREGRARIEPSLPYVPGIEAVGTIEEIGKGVDGGWKVGDRVMPFLMTCCGVCRYCQSGREQLCGTAGFISFTTSGAYAELMVCSAAQLIHVPAELTDEAAASLQLSFATAWHMLFTRGCLRAGETVLVSSVGSGLGTAAVQLAQLAGALVIGTASDDAKLERARALGLDAGVNYCKSDIPTEVRRLTENRGVDVVFEHVGGDAFQYGLDSLAKDGRLVVCGAHSQEIVPLDIVPLFRSEKTIIGSTVFTRAEVETVLEIARRGRIRPVVDRTFPLDEARAATEYLESRANFGKILLMP